MELNQSLARIQGGKKMSKKCPICEKRKQFWKMLNKLSDFEREMQRSARLTTSIDKEGKEVRKWEPGKRDALNECCCKRNILGSTGYEYDWERKKWKSHYHACQECGKRWPEKGGYAGEYFNDDLGTLPNGDLFEIVSPEEKQKQTKKLIGGKQNENKQNIICTNSANLAVSEPSVC